MLLFFGTLKIVKFQEKWLLGMWQATYNMCYEIILKLELLPCFLLMETLIIFLAKFGKDANELKLALVVGLWK